MTIWNFLKGIYNGYPNFEYLLLIGDIPQYPGDQNGIEMPKWTVFRDANGKIAPSDICYTRLTPLEESDPLLTDIYPDITVGRMVVNNIQEFANIVNKTTNYFYSDNSNYPWEKKCLLVASKKDYSFRRDDFFTHFKLLIEDSDDMYYMYPPQEFHRAYGQYDYGTNENVRNYINNDGCSIVNYIGHGVTNNPQIPHGWKEWANDGESWNEVNISELYNYDKLVVVFQACCQVGQIDDSNGNDCLCEHWMNSPNGAVACCGSTRDLTGFIYPIPDGFDHLFFIDVYWFHCIYGCTDPYREPIESFGTVVNTGIVEWLCTFPFLSYLPHSLTYTLSGEGVGMVDSITIYGDPSLKMRSGVDFQSYAKDDKTKKEVLGLGNLFIDSIYPNPSYNDFNYKINVPTSGIVSIHIYDISGRLVSERTLYAERPGLIESSVDVRDLSNGVYTFSAEMNGSDVSKRIVIVR